MQSPGVRAGAGLVVVKAQTHPTLVRRATRAAAPTVVISARGAQQERRSDTRGRGGDGGAGGAASGGDGVRLVGSPRNFRVDG